jgi:hypothetical protein
MGSGGTHAAVCRARTASADNWDGLGERAFRVLPRRGEQVQFNDPDGIGQCYEVVAVHHPLDPDRTVACDLYVVRIGTITDVLGQLFRESPAVS